jgi:tetratricopeptide (TPR) repeat protein
MTANRIIQHIFQEPEIKQVEEAALEQLVTAYPYFTTARLLLAKKQYTAQRNLLAPAVKKAQLYSNNMHYFYRFITSVEPVAVPEPVAFVEPEPVQPEYIQPEKPAYTPLLDETFTSFPITKDLEQVREETVIEEPVIEEPVIEEPVVTPEPEPIIEELPVIEEPTVQPEAVYEEPVILTEPETAPEVPESSIYVAQAPVTEVLVHKDMADTTVDTHAAEEQIKIFPLEVNNQKEESVLTYQPLYTDDYFAYKRLKEPEQAEVLNEKGASEMKSFTSWLKDIKSTFSEKSTKQQYHEQLTRSYEDFDPEVSEAVEKAAMDSITLTDDVVSETLAEIWAKQRQYQTAIHIYQKLSLLNPNKSAYFAQKIQEIQLLKDNN